MDTRAAAGPPAQPAPGGRVPETDRGADDERLPASDVTVQGDNVANVGSVSVHDQEDDPSIRKEVGEKIAKGQWVTYSNPEAGSERASKAWDTFLLVKDSATDQAMPYVQCRVCLRVMTYNKAKRKATRSTGVSTSKLLGHQRTCTVKQPPAASADKPVEVSREEKTGVLDRIVDWCVGQLQSHRNVDGQQFRNMCQELIDIGAKHPGTKVEDVLPHSTNITRRLNDRASQIREEKLPEILQAIDQGVVSATTDSWTCKNRLRHYIALTLHYIVDVSESELQKPEEERDNGHRSVLFFINNFALKSATGENILADMKTQFELRQIPSEKIEKIHFVTDDGSNQVKAIELGGYSRSYCQDHLLNVTLSRTFTPHLNRVDLMGDSGGALCDKIRHAMVFLKGHSKTPKGFRSQISVGPEDRRQTLFKSSLPMLRFAHNNHVKVRKVKGRVQGSL